MITAVMSPPIASLMTSQRVRVMLCNPDEPLDSSPLIMRSSHLYSSLLERAPDGFWIKSEVFANLN